MKRPSSRRTATCAGLLATAVTATLVATTGTSAQAAPTTERPRAAAPVPTSTQAAWARRATTLTTTALSEATTRRDVAALDAAIGRSRIVLLGEASHGQHEHFAVKNRIIEHLVTRRGFTTVALEDGVGRAAGVGSYVSAGTGTAASAVDGLMGWWASEEFEELAEVLRSHHRGGGRPATFVGMDIPQAGTQEEVDLLTAWFSRKDPAFARTAGAALARFRVGPDEMASYRAKDRAEQDAVRAGLRRVERRLAALRGRFSRATPAERAAYQAAHQAAVALLAGERYYRLDPEDAAATDDVREQGMTDLVAAALERDPAAKVIVWAHDMHAGEFRNQYDPAWDVTIKASLGARLTDRFGEAAVTTVGLTFDRGTVGAMDASREYATRKIDLAPVGAGSYEELFRTHRPGSFVLPLNRGGVQALRAPRPMRVSIGGAYDPTKPEAVSVTASLPEVFDAVVHTETTTAARLRGLSGARAVTLGGRSLQVLETCQPDNQGLEVKALDGDVPTTLRLRFAAERTVDVTVERAGTTYTAAGVTPEVADRTLTVRTTATGPGGESLDVSIVSDGAYGC